jgi:uncharacterized protein (TIRG00374 family)
VPSEAPDLSATEPLSGTVSVSRRRSLVLLAKLAVTLGLLGFLISRTPLDEVSTRLRSIGAPSISLVVAIFFLILLTTASRWQVVLRHFGETVGFGGLWRYTLIGGFFNQLLPSGMGGDVFRIWYARSFHVSTGKAVASVVVDRMLGLVAIAIIVIPGTPFILSASPPPFFFWAAIVAMTCVVAGIAAFMSLDALEQPLSGIIRQITSARIRGSAYRMLSGTTWAAKSTRKLFVAWPHGPLALGISIGNQLLICYVVFLLLRAMDVSITFGSVVFLFPFVELLNMLPISFAGWGLREGAMVVAFALVGVPADAALSASILYGLCLLGASLPGALVWLVIRRRPIPAR